MKPRLPSLIIVVSRPGNESISVREVWAQKSAFTSLISSGSICVCIVYHSVFPSLIICGSTGSSSIHNWTLRIPFEIPP